MSDDGRSGQVLGLIKRHAGSLDALAETRCPHDGRLLGAAYWLADGLWVWSAGHREPPQVARREAAASCLDALDECQTAEDQRACYEAASDALSADIRPVARPAVLHVEIGPANTDWYEITDLAMSMVGGPRFLVTEVSCGCRRHFYLDLHSLILAANATASRPHRAQRARKHVPPLPPDLPETRGSEAARIRAESSRVIRRRREMSTTD